MYRVVPLPRFANASVEMLLLYMLCVGPRTLIRMLLQIFLQIFVNLLFLVYLMRRIDPSVALVFKLRNVCVMRSFIVCRGCLEVKEMTACVCLCVSLSRPTGSTHAIAIIFSPISPKN